jgi:outer membrane receptor for ferrienterochelin and colicins
VSRPRHPILFATAIAVLGRPALADDKNDLQSLLSENIITTASTAAQKESTAPSTSVTLTADDFRTYGIRSLDEAINFLSLGVVTQNPLSTVDIGTRGVLLPGDNGKHFLLLVNGHALNDPLYGAARFDDGAGIPLDIVDHIEVIVGPGSVLYGSNAMLGVINVITKNAADYPGARVYGDYELGRAYRIGAGAGVTFKAFGAPSELTTSLEYFSRTGPDFNFDVIHVPRNPGDGQFPRMRRGGPADGIWGGTLRDAYFAEAPSGSVRLRVGRLELNLLGSLYRRGIPYSNGAVNVDFDDPDSFEVDRALRLDLKHQATLSATVQLASRLYGDAFDHQRRVNRDGIGGCFQSHIQTCQYYDAGLSRWAGIEERLSLNWFGDLTFVTLAGIDARMRWVRAKQEALDFDTGQPFAPTTGRISDGDGIISPYLQQTWSPTRSLDINAGARLDADRRFDPIVSPRGAIAFSPYRSTTFKVIYSQAFRAPTWAETDASNYQQAKSDDLKPETTRSVEGSIEQRFGTHRILFGAFRTNWSNIVEPAVLSITEKAALQVRGELPLAVYDVSQYRNVSNIDNYGWNGALSGTFGESRLSYGVNVTGAFTRKQTSAGTPQQLEVAPQLFGNARVSYAAGGLIPTPAIAVHYVGQRPADRSAGGVFSSLPIAPPLAEFRGTLSGKVPGLPGIEYRLSAAYTTASRTAYASGPGALGVGNPVLQPGSLIPVDQFRVFLGLRYDFLTGSERSSLGGPP